MKRAQWRARYTCEIADCKTRGKRGAGWGCWWVVEWFPTCQNRNACILPKTKTHDCCGGHPSVCGQWLSSFMVTRCFEMYTGWKIMNKILKILSNEIISENLNWRHAAPPLLTIGYILSWEQNRSWAWWFKEQMSFWLENNEKRRRKIPNETHIGWKHTGFKACLRGQSGSAPGQLGSLLERRFLYGRSWRKPHVRKFCFVCENHQAARFVSGNQARPHAKLIGCQALSSYGFIKG